MSNPECLDYVISYGASGNKLTSQSDIDNVAYNCTLTYGTCTIFGRLYSLSVDVYIRSYVTGTTNKRHDK